MVEDWLLKTLCKHRRVYLSMEGRGLESEVYVYECVCVYIHTHAHSYLGKRSRGHLETGDGAQLRPHSHWASDNQSSQDS